MNTDRPLKNMPTADLRVLSNDLHDAIQSAKFCGLHATAEKLEYIRLPILSELNSPIRRLAEGKPLQSCYTSSGSNKSSTAC